VLFKERAGILNMHPRTRFETIDIDSRNATIRGGDYSG